MQKENLFFFSFPSESTFKAYSSHTYGSFYPHVIKESVGRVVHHQLVTFLNAYAERLNQEDIDHHLPVFSPHNLPKIQLDDCFDQNT